MNSVNLFAAVTFGVFKRKPPDAGRGLLRDDFQTLDDARDNLMLEA
jgi:hypothetical protein